jgi:hypothetical protein
MRLVLSFVSGLAATQGVDIDIDELLVGHGRAPRTNRRI